MLFLESTPNVAPILDLILTWTHIGQALVGSIGALAFDEAVIDQMRHAASLHRATRGVDNI
jgi:hypothetical protein